MRIDSAKSNAEAAKGFLEKAVELITEEYLNVMREADHYDETVQHLECAVQHLDQSIKDLS